MCSRGTYVYPYTCVCTVLYMHLHITVALTHLFQDVPDLAAELLWDSVQCPIQSPASSPHTHTLHHVMLFPICPHHSNVVLQLDGDVSLTVSDNGDLRNSFVVASTTVGRCIHTNSSRYACTYVCTHSGTHCCNSVCTVHWWYFCGVYT